MISRAVVYKESLTRGEGLGYELLQNFQCPKLDSHDVLIQVSACRVKNHNERLYGITTLKSDDAVPFGKEVSGVVVEVGPEVTQYKNGSEVTGILPLDAVCSGCANYCVMSEFDIVPKPTTVSHVDAAAIIGDGLRAYTALLYQAKLLSGDTVLICGGTTGHNMAAIQLAQHIGAKVIATVTTEEELIYLNNHRPPLAQVIDLTTKKGSLVSICMEETGGLGIDCVIDSGVKMFGKDFEEYENKSSVDKILPKKQDVLNCLAVGGRWITSQSNLQLDPEDSRILFLKCASVHYLFEHSWTLSRGAQGKYLHILQDILHKVKDGVLRPAILRTVHLDSLVQSMAETRYSNVGEIVMTTTHLAT